jgi:hypothetical protein
VQNKARPSDQRGDQQRLLNSRQQPPALQHSPAGLQQPCLRANETKLVRDAVCAAESMQLCSRGCDAEGLLMLLACSAPEQNKEEGQAVEGGDHPDCAQLHRQVRLLVMAVCAPLPRSTAQQCTQQQPQQHQPWCDWQLLRVHGAAADKMQLQQTRPTQQIPAETASSKSAASGCCATCEVTQGLCVNTVQHSLPVRQAQHADGLLGCDLSHLAASVHFRPCLLTTGFPCEHIFTILQAPPAFSSPC